MIQDHTEAKALFELANHTVDLSKTCIRVKKDELDIQAPFLQLIVSYYTWYDTEKDTRLEAPKAVGEVLRMMETWGNALIDHIKDASEEQKALLKEQWNEKCSLEARYQLPVFGYRIPMKRIAENAQLYGAPVDVVLSGETEKERRKIANSIAKLELKSDSKKWQLNALAAYYLINRDKSAAVRERAGLEASPGSFFIKYDSQALYYAGLLSSKTPGGNLMNIYEIASSNLIELQKREPESTNIGFTHPLVGFRFLPGSEKNEEAELWTLEKLVKSSYYHIGYMEKENKQDPPAQPDPDPTAAPKQEKTQDLEK